jgi:membrane protein DedA with SNARE-associated domain
MGHGISPAPAPMTSVSALVAQYGYLMVFAGALAEGESVLIAAGFAAHRGLLQLPWVIVLAAAAGALGDQIFFYLGRRHGPRLLARWPLMAQRVQRVQPLLRRHPNLAILGVRFMVGLRTAGPVALGALGVPRWKFALFNGAGALLWATLFSLLGWHFGQALQWLLYDLRAAEEGLLVGLFVLALAVSLWWRWRRRRAEQPPI